MSGVRLFFLFFIACFGLFLSSAGWNIFLPAFSPIPNLSFLTLLYVSLLGSHAFSPKTQQNLPKISSGSIVFFGLLLGYFSDLVFGTPVGFQALLFASFSFVVWVVSGKMIGGGWLFAIIFGGITSFLYQVIFLTMWHFFISPVQTGSKRIIIMMILISALITPLFFSILRRFDRRIFKRFGGMILG